MVSLDIGRPAGPDPRPLIERLEASPRPAVVQYPDAADPEGRVELSGRVLVNWAAKTANLLDVEGLSTGSRVTVDLPAAWKSLAVTLGAVWAGAELTLCPRLLGSAGAESTDAVLTDRPEQWADHPGVLIAVSPGATDTEFGAELPVHAVDLSAEVRQQADQFLLPAPDLSPATLPALAQDELPDGGSVASSDQLTEESASPTPPLEWIAEQSRGTAVTAGGRRLDAALLQAAVTAWDVLRPVVLVPAESLATLDEASSQALTDEGLTP